MKKITVLGAGLVGKAMAVDLCRDYEVTSVDISEEILQEIKGRHPIKTRKADLSDKAQIQAAIADSDVVVGAAPGFMGFEVLKSVIEAGKNVVDISFFEEDPFDLDALAKEKGVTAVVDCGVAPGMSNIYAGYHNQRMKLDSYECFVGGLPIVRVHPYEYKAPFSPISVIDEYVRPARLVVDGNVVVREALSEVEPYECPQVGTLEAFNTDGLRSLIKTIPLPNMKEKTLRYPGHARDMSLLRDIGFFGEKEISLKGGKVSPLEMTAKLLFPKWKLEPGEEEFTFCAVTLGGERDGKRVKIGYTLFDRYHKATQTSSMARTTGYTCTSVARLVLDGHFTRKGICPPEYVGATDGCYEKVSYYMKEREIVYTEYEEMVG